MSDSKRPTDPSVTPSAPAGESATSRAVNRRQFIRTAAGATAAATLSASAVACGDGSGSGRPDTGADVRADAASDATADSTTDIAADAAADAADTATDAAADAAADVPPDGGAVTSLQPVRGDGSHPFHYIEHVVIVQMENRSFDHYFGALGVVEGRTDVTCWPANYTNPATDGRQVGLVHLDTEWVFDPDPPHGHRSCVAQHNAGGMDGFVREWEDELTPENFEERLRWIMGYHTRDQLPSLYGMADNFALFDHWFCGMRGPTWPNRFFSHAGTSEGLTSNRTPISSKTPYSLMLERNLRVACYHQTLVRFMMILQDIPLGTYEDYYLEDFFTHAAEGTLPNVSVLEPDYAFNDDHPPQDIRFGQAFIGSIYEALRQSPNWDRTLMVVFYDEHGGFPDHVPPPRVAGEAEDSPFGYMGVRVPAVMAGGMVKRGYVHNGVVEHSSVPRMLCDIFDLPHLNDRTRNAGDLGAALDLELTLNSARPDAPELPPVILPDAKLRAAMNIPNGQPELLEYCQRLLRRQEFSVDQRTRIMERNMEIAQRLGSVRIL